MPDDGPIEGLLLEFGRASARKWRAGGFAIMRRSEASLGSATVIGAALAVLLLGCGGGGRAPAPPAALKVAPDFALKDLQGNLYHSSDAKGTVRLVDFWATWCAPCRQEVPMFKDFHAAYGSKGFTLVGIAMDDEGVEKVKPYVDDMKIPYLTLIGDEGVVDAFGGVVGFPTKFLIDREGRIVDSWVGEVPRAVLEKKIQSLL
jgi:cytochrome c biogenesis protein CcmG/thiol:disulfide interchange protein DsbE